MKTFIVTSTFIAIFLFSCSLLQAQHPSGKTILENVDKNISSKNRVFSSKMVIHGRRGSRTVESKSWAEGEEKAFTEYLAPAREKGTKLLKLKDKLWMYSPSTDRTIHISGHMLRQSVMGSDLSYEDMMEDPKLTNHYDAVVTSTESFEGRPCWVLKLKAKTKDVAYFMRTIWVDQSRVIPLKEELYAKSGKLLKKLELKDVTKIEDRWFPKRMIFKDMLKKGKGTEFIFQDIKFDQDIPKHIFSKAALRK
ncbi:MAG: outer membrane lipoprotein-sorting protein [Desulfobacteraceae bacterium]|nr:outer membrane lipoprotein-sorting protein [Desulfobacteraceae bacterium]